GCKATDVGCTTPDANVSRVPLERTRKIETGTSCPRVPLYVTYKLPSWSKTGLSTWCSPVARGSATSTKTVSPTTPSPRTGPRPPSPIGGTIIAIVVGDAYTTRARRSPIRTSGRAGPSTSKSDPSIASRPPSVARAGRTAVRRELRCMLAVGKRYPEDLYTDTQDDTLTQVTLLSS